MKTESVCTVLIGLVVASALIGCAGPERQPSGDQSLKPNRQETDEIPDATEFDLPPHRFIKRGMDASRITSLVGSPVRKVEHPDRPDVWHYQFGLVLMEGGQVQYKHPSSRTEREQKGPALETSP